MIGKSAQPMIEWINRREDHILWFSRRVTEECRAIRPTILEEAVGLRLSWADFNVAFTAVSGFLKLGLHPGGDHAANVAQIVDGVVQLQRQIELALEQRRS